LPVIVKLIKLLLLNIHDNPYLAYYRIWRPVMWMAEFFPSTLM